MDTDTPVTRTPTVLSFPSRQPDHFDGVIDVPWPTVADTIRKAEADYRTFDYAAFALNAAKLAVGK